MCVSSPYRHGTTVRLSPAAPRSHPPHAKLSPRGLDRRLAVVECGLSLLASSLTSVRRLLGRAVPAMKASPAASPAASAATGDKPPSSALWAALAAASRSLA
mmetsp:Transcript_36886/g.120607  ORF Transcript_36886/g.120607 Transcript_36886/m.120607 type:complete len:102 (-) Transcript_36886:1253-1558(-)